MADCTRNDVAARLAAGLSSGEFSDDAAAPDGHLRTRGRCREEMQALRLIDVFLKEHEASQNPAFSVCPTVDALANFAEGRDDSTEIAIHLACCPDCADYVQLVSDLALQDLPMASERPTDAQMRFVRDTIALPYGINQKNRSFGIDSLFGTLRAPWILPSLAIAAVAAALLLAFLLP